ncbi:MAG TPA: CHRD domain-containing protein [Acidimicrobiia bacterium]|nr:CHRD domain-containing protein [Acidimicrobiia bacterium]
MRPLPGDAADPTGAPRVTRPAVGSARVRHRHVHRAPAGETGPHHIELLNDEKLAGSRNQVEFCVHPEGSADALQEVVDDPDGFYLNVHSTAYPNGAIRGQLDS